MESPKIDPSDSKPSEPTPLAFEKQPMPKAQPEDWLEQHGNLLFKFALLRVRDPHTAEDLVQETLVKAFAAFDRFRGEASVKSWLFKILSNEINSYFRKRKREQNSLVHDPHSGDPIPIDQLLSPEMTPPQFASAVERDEFWEIIQRCFEQVPEHLLQTFLYRLAQPREKIENLCAELEINASNFSVRLFRTRLLLRKCLEQKWNNQ